MYRETLSIAVVEDEPLVRDLIRNCVDWDELGITIEYVAADGEAALSAIQVNPTDILLTDICMPRMNGLQLTEAVKRDFPSTEVVILTGHSEFEYARRSISLGVAEYVMKPINDDELTRVLRSTADEIRSNPRYKSKKDSTEISPLIRRVQEYVDSNLGNPDLSLTAVADRFNISSAHLSRRFHRETDETLIGHIIRKRMERSVDLVETTDLLVYEIGEMVGIQDAHYFGLCFKRYTGMTATEYRRRLNSPPDTGRLRGDAFAPD